MGIARNIARLIPNGSGELSTANIAAGAIVEADIAANAVTQAKLNTSVIPVGAGQVWQYVTRAKRTTYQNTTGRPIAVAVSFVCPFTSVLQLWTHSSSGDILTNGVQIMQADGGDYFSGSQFTNHAANISAIIPNNYYYQAYDPEDNVTINLWTELR